MQVLWYYRVQKMLESAMTWTPWIETVPVDTDDPEVRQLYERTKNPRTGYPSDVVRLTSLTPEVAGLMNDLNRAVLVNAKGLNNLPSCASSVKTGRNESVMISKE